MIHPPAAAALVLLLALAVAARAQISAAPMGAPAAALDCSGALLSLTPCLTYVERRSALTRPDKGCCGALAGVAGGDDAACFCGLVAGYGAHGVRVDPVRALALPTICRVAAPPPRLCAALGMPVAEPPGGAAAAPGESGSDVPTITPDAAAANGSPSTALQQSSRHLYLLSLPHCFILLSATLLLLLL
ncbi:hypothetical protein QOZ80_3BG0281610 [Eleusine coracana subsp. coracana]|nr:hypothetical protein QOZ80_3BG0281610 [Eleusine coracana subsp. coracana]